MPQPRWPSWRRATPARAVAGCVSERSVASKRVTSARRSGFTAAGGWDSAAASYSGEGSVRRNQLRGAAIGAAVAPPAAAAGAASLRWANDGDVNSMDPYARQETFPPPFDGNMYEPLIGRDRNLK